ncbi:MAG: 50S ribosomal protein L32 [Abditibacteriales bacterium]|nr:50S ribosomal protein L32 [Abditibacteriales bacterium]MDW8366176.1 50S ribosomal protein L32 [Abditibacteriales bacterium]
MALPKRRKSHAKVRTRRQATFRLRAVAFSACPSCGQPTPSHRACPYCGHYGDKGVVLRIRRKKEAKKQ